MGVGMSIKLMTWAWETSFPQTEKMVLLCLCDFANDHGSCWPAVDTIARKCSVSDRTVQRAMKRLQDWGILTVKMATGRANEYHINPRHSVTPDTVSPPTMTTKPPTQCHPTPDTVSPKPSKNHQEPSEDCASDDALTPDDLVETWNDFAPKYGLPVVRGKLSKARRQQARARLREYPDPADWRRAFHCIADCKWMHGDNDRGWRADFDFLIQAKSLPKLVEQSYGKN